MSQNEPQCENCPAGYEGKPMMHTVEYKDGSIKEQMLCAECHATLEETQENVVSVD